MNCLKQIKLVALTILLVASSSLLAYDFGGHYYTLSAVFHDPQKPRESKALKLKELEVFCSELPDISEELDATTQRIHVAYPTRDWGWGLLGWSDGKTSRHMIAVQVYLHALTGSNVRPIKEAARKIISQIDNKIDKGTNTSLEMMRLYCERGFADHLLGDTYAHANPHKWDYKNKDGVLFPTGLGHFKDSHDPDHMLTKNFYFEMLQRKWNAAYVREISHDELATEAIENQPVLWGDWLKEASCTISKDCSSDWKAYLRIQDNTINAALNDANKGGGRLDQLVKANFMEDRFLMDFYNPAFDPPFNKTPPDYKSIRDWNDKHSSAPLIRGLIDMYHAANLDVLCSKRVEQGLIAIKLPLIDGAQFCHDVWAEYKKIAFKTFPKNIDVTMNLDIEKDSLEDGE